MKNFFLVTGLAVGLLGAGTALAAGESCDKVKGEIAAKIDANGVKHYSLEVVDKGAATDGKVVGNCGHGAKEIVYKRG
jgi:hypothetical protein